MIRHKNLGVAFSNQKLTVQLRINRRLAAMDVVLFFSRDNRETGEYKMLWCGMRNDYDVYETVINAPETGLYFYEFAIDSKSVRQKKGEIVTDGGDKFQLSVIEKVYESPEYLYGGLMYQIMPDRFYFEKQIKSRNDVIYQDDWFSTPLYKPNSNGIVENRDFFGGNLDGIIKKLDYLKSLSVTCVYLNPIFEAYSNHKYDTADYKKIDPLFGTNEDFIRLCKEAKARGISVILDGVFSHTGVDSVYFNKYGKYREVGAYQSEKSEYYKWYTFLKHPDVYESWWGIDILPNINETEPTFNEFINGKDGVIRYWMRLGADGWRLDVADELPGSFLRNITKAAKAEKSDSLVLGEVWEDASNKISYGVRREYFLGKELDSVTNYPFKDAIINFINAGNAYGISSTVQSIVNNYPEHTLHCLMNILGSHDTARILTNLSGISASSMSKDERAEFKLNAIQKNEAIKKLRLAAALQYTLPGVPCLYYGDEAGLEGYEDPFSRRCYPWGREIKPLVEFYRKLGKFRLEQSVLKKGSYEKIFADNGVYAFRRFDENEELVVAVNTSENNFKLHLDGTYYDIFENSESDLTVPPASFVFLKPF